LPMDAKSMPIFLKANEEDLSKIEERGYLCYNGSPRSNNTVII
jgi:hypothetical protein